MFIYISFPGIFKLSVEFTEEYPNKPPTVRFVSKMFHPNGGYPGIQHIILRVIMLPCLSVWSLVVHSLCRWQYMFGHLAEPLESHLRCVSHSHIYPGLTPLFHLVKSKIHFLQMYLNSSPCINLNEMHVHERFPFSFTVPA